MCRQNKELNPHTNLMVLAEQIFQSGNLENKIVTEKFQQEAKMLKHTHCVTETYS